MLARLRCVISSVRSHLTIASEARNSVWRTSLLVFLGTLAGGVQSLHADIYQPYNVAASDSSSQSNISINWNVGPDTCQTLLGCPVQYYIYYSTTDTVDCTESYPRITGPSDFAALWFPMLPNQSFVWTGATPGVRYRFAILADAGNFLPDQCSTRWGSTDFGSRGLPGSPGFSGVPTRNNANGINVSWNDYNASYGVQHWRLYRSASAANRCSDTHIATLPRSTRSFLDSSAAFNTDYYYTFIASDLNGVNGPCSSNSAAGFRPGQAPTVSAISVSPATVVAAGTTVNLGVSATGAIPSNTVAYQWRAAGQVVGGSSPSYSFVGQGNHGTKQYDVLVSHPESAFSVTRSQNITVCRADQIVSNNACVCPGTLQEIGGQCACPPPLVRVDNQCLAPTPTPTATPLPNSFPQIINQPQSQSVQEGQSVTFGVVAAGNPVPNYQWFRDNLNPVGGNDPQYSFVAALSDNGARFKVRVSNSVGSVDSNEVILTVQSAPRPLRPVLECVMANNDGTLTAFFGYENQNIAAVTIPAGTNSGGDANLVNGGSILPGTQQPIDFSPGRVRGAFGVVFSAQGSAAYTLGYRGTGIVTETANSQSTPCAPIEPRLACVNPEGAGFRARFTYSNQNAFNVIIPSGPNNRFSPAPEYRDQPINFLAALGQSDHFEVVSSSGGDLTWILANLSATASGNSTPCSLPPVCNAGGPYRVQQGQNQVTLNASGSFDPEGLPLIYAWSTTCPGASIAGTLSPLATLNLVGNRQTCAVNLAVSDGTGVSQCSAEISFDEVPICVNDRCGVPCGDGMSCCGCVQVDNSAAILALGTNYSQLDLSVKKTTRLVRRLAPKGSKSAKLAKKTSKALSDLRLVSRSVLIGLPSVMTDCTAFFVVKSNNQGALQAIDDTANQYQILNNKLAKQAKKEGLPVRKSGKAVIKNALGKLNQALSIIPAQDESCNTP